MTFIAGRYTASWNGYSLGQTAEGIKLSHKFFKRAVKGDAGAETKQDSVYRGAEVSGDARFIEADLAGIKAMVWPYAGTLYDLGVIGRLDVASNIAKPLILTAVAGTNATPATYTFPLSILAEGFPVEILLAPDLREVPIRWDFYYSGVTSSGNSLNTCGTVT